MKKVAPDQVERLPGRKLEDADTFSFHCHSGLACFNRCCRNLNLFLYPYDVARLRSCLGISSDAFLDRYVDVVLRPSARFPDVMLRMAENPERTCPFLDASGCSVYPDRPETCRSFPVEHGALFEGGDGQARVVRFFRPPDFCLGRHEPRRWTPERWIQDQGAQAHVAMTLAWAELKGLLETVAWESDDPAGPKARMAFMAAYNADRFRQFVFQSTFLERFAVEPRLLERIRSDDRSLVAFGFQWVKLFLWGIRTEGLAPRR